MYDYIIIGGGIVGLSTAWQLQQRMPSKKIVLLEKEAGIAEHQTRHNSGVIHAGVYYAPGSLKARFCKDGIEATFDFCKEHNIPYKQCGKLLVATNKLELARMQVLYERCLESDLDVQLLNQAELKEREHNIVGLGAIYVKRTGIVDYQRVCIEMLRCFRELGGEARLDTKVIGLCEQSDRVVVSTNSGELGGRFLIACAGLMADRICKLMSIDIDFQIVPFRGEYYLLADRVQDIVDHLIYPIPDPNLPFLGVHLTPMINGSVTVGPNAVQGWKREGYGKVNFSTRDAWEMCTFPGFWRVLIEHFGTGLSETWDSWCKYSYLKRVQKYCPQLKISDLKPYPAGIRAQAVSRNGELVHDFLFAASTRSLHVCNAPSPAATAAIPIGASVCDRVIEAGARINIRNATSEQ